MATFTTKHYEKLAKLLKAQRPADHWCANKRVQWDLIVLSMVEMFTADNPRFDGYRFLLACGVSIPEVLQREANKRRAI